MCALTAPGLVAHLTRGDRSVATLHEVVGDFAGTVVCDALSTHIAAARDGPIDLAGGRAHVRRKSAGAEPGFPQARVALTHIRALYDIDAEATDADSRLALRRSRSIAVLAHKARAPRHGPRAGRGLRR